MRLPKHYRKNKRTLWRKGETSSSNPKTTKFREAVRDSHRKGGFRNGGHVKGKPIIHPPGYSGDMDMEGGSMHDADKLSVASVITTASNPLFGDFTAQALDNNLANSEYRQRRLALLGAVTDAIRANHGRETCNEYYSVFMNLLSSSITRDNLEAVCDLLARVITKGLTKNVLQHAFPKACPILMKTLAETKSNETSIQRHLVISLGHFLSTVPSSTWSTNPICGQCFEQLLPFCVNRKVSLRQAACLNIASVLLSTQQQHKSTNATIVENIWLKYLKQHQVHFTQLSTSDSVEMDMVFMCQMIAHCWSALTPQAIHMALRDILLPLMRVFMNHRVQKYFIVLFQELFQQYLSEQHISLKLCEETLMCLFEARPALAAWLLQNNTTTPTQSSVKAAAEEKETSKRHPMLDNLQCWLDAVSAALTHTCRQAIHNFELENTSGPVSTQSTSKEWIQLFCFLFPQFMELSLEWLLIDRQSLVSPLIDKQMHCLLRQEVICASHLVDMKWFEVIIDKLVGCLSGMDYDTHWHILVRLAENFLHIICSAVEKDSMNEVILPPMLQNKIVNMLSQMAALRAFQRPQVPFSANELNESLDSLFGSAVELLGAHWVLDQGLGVNVLKELQERGNLRHNWILPLLVRYTKNTRLSYFRERLLPSLVTLHDLLKEQMRQLSSLPGTRTAHSDKMQRKNPRVRKSSNRSSDSEHDESEGMDIDEEPLETMKEEEEDLDNLTEEVKQRRIMEQSCANVESLFRHLWATLPGFCTNPLDLLPVNEEPYLLTKILLQIHCQWSQLTESFNVHLISLYRGSLYKGLSALCKSISDKQANEDSDWQEITEKWISALQQDSCDINQKEVILRSFVNCLTNERKNAFIKSALTIVKKAQLTSDQVSLLKSLMPLMDSTTQQKLLKSCILIIKKVCASHVEDTATAEDKKLERLTLKVVSTLCVHSQVDKTLSLALRLLCESQSFNVFSALCKTRLQCWQSILTNAQCPQPTEPVCQSLLTEILACVGYNAKSRQLASELLPLCCDWISRDNSQTVSNMVERLKQLIRGSVDTPNVEVTLNQRLHAGEVIRILLLAPAYTSTVNNDDDQSESTLRSWKEAVVKCAVSIARELVRNSEKRLTRLGLQLAQALFSKGAVQGNSSAIFSLEEQIAVLRSINKNVSSLRLEVKKLLTRMVTLHGVDVVRKCVKNQDVLKLIKNMVKFDKQKH